MNLAALLHLTRGKRYAAAAASRRGNVATNSYAGSVRKSTNSSADTSRSRSHAASA